MVVTYSVLENAGPQRPAAVSDAIFGNRGLSELTPAERIMLANEAPSLRLTSERLASGTSVTDALVESELASSKSDARRLLEGKGITLNGETVEADRALVVADFVGNLGLLRRGKQVAVLTIEK